MNQKPKAISRKQMTDAELSDDVLYCGYKIPTAQAASKRAARLYATSLSENTERLPWCLGGSECGLLSCPRCRWRAQHIFIAQMLPVIRAERGAALWSSITIIPEFGVMVACKLPRSGLRGFKDQICAAMRKMAPDAVGVFCIDISLERNLGQREFLQLHVHGIIRDLSADECNRICRRFAWQKDSSCYRPVQTEPVYDSFGQLAYMSKPQFFRRDQYTNAKGKLQHQKKIMSFEQEFQLVKALSAFKAQQRIFYLGMQPLK